MTVDALVAALPEPSRAAMQVLRGLVAASHPDVTEHVKWNGPSFVIGGDDRISLGVAKGGAVRAVLHRGAKVKSTDGVAFQDDSGLIEWAALDRGEVTFADETDVAVKAGYLTTVTMSFSPLDGDTRTLVRIAEEGWRETPTGLKAYVEYDINLREGPYR